ncbi:MAG: transcriptional regulator NrdR [Rickettsiaceae bacterium]|nr:transcriptional regulator NrdR [Rickettsiaceae bacterium]
MRCPFCNSLNTSVKDSRQIHKHNIIKRRRYCEVCHSKFSTTEQPILREIYVIKRSGAKKPFDRAKIYTSIKTALRKRNTDDAKIETMVDQICIALQKSNEIYINTRKIGDLILQSLADVDEVAYIRFASVYKDFMSAQDFSQFIDALNRKKT